MKSSVELRLDRNLSMSPPCVSKIGRVEVVEGSGGGGVLVLGEVFKT